MTESADDNQAFADPNDVVTIFDVGNGATEAIMDEVRDKIDNQDWWNVSWIPTKVARAIPFVGMGVSYVTADDGERLEAAAASGSGEIVSTAAGILGFAAVNPVVGAITAIVTGLAYSLGGPEDAVKDALVNGLSDPTIQDNGDSLEVNISEGTYSYRFEVNEDGQIIREINDNGNTIKIIQEGIEGGSQFEYSVNGVGIGYNSNGDIYVYDLADGYFETLSSTQQPSTQMQQKLDKAIDEVETALGTTLNIPTYTSPETGLLVADGTDTDTVSTETGFRIQKTPIGTNLQFGTDVEVQIFAPGEYIIMYKGEQGSQVLTRSDDGQFRFTYGPDAQDSVTFSDPSELTGTEAQLYADFFNTVNPIYSAGLKDVANDFPVLFSDPNGDIPDGIGDFLLPLLPPSFFQEPNLPIPGFGPAAKEPWDEAPTILSPLVLDLDGDGIEVTTFNASTTTTFFDLDNDSFAEQAAWLTANQDGLLARDLDANGKIDNAGELFGSSSVDGFALLAELDTNGDQKIDQYDNDWSDLVVWKDASGDALTQDGELVTLSSLSIKSIDLAGITASTSTINGNPVSHTSTYTLDGGTTRSIADVWFVTDDINTYYAQDYDLDIRAIFLPTLRGFGKLPDLHIAMSLDNNGSGSLLDLVSDLAFTWSISDYSADMEQDVRDILFRWAGVDDVVAGSRGAYIDAQELEFMEEFFGEEFVYPKGTNPHGNPAVELKEAWEILFGNLKAQLLVQVGAEDIFDDASYNPRSGEIEGDLDLVQSVIDDLETEATAAPDAEAYWSAFARFLDFSRGIDDLTSTEEGWLDDAVQASDASLTWDYIVTHSLPTIVGDTVTGTTGDDVLDGTSGDDYIYGYEGNDDLTAGDGEDNVYGGDGNDEIYGENGNDELYGGNGDDVIYGAVGNDHLQGDGGVDTLYGGSGVDYVDGGADDDTLYGGSDNDELYGAAGADSLYGDAGNDELWGGAGSDTLYAGLGADTVYGGNDSDTYVFEGGTDAYSEGFYEGTNDVIELPSGITLQDLTFYRIEDDDANRNNLIIEIGTLGSIELIDSFNGSGDYVGGMESIEFSDASTLDFVDITELTTYGGDGDDFIVGVYTSLEIDDTLYGGKGNDTLWGQAGDDILDGGDGNDTFDGGTGNDIIIASAGFDTITESGGTDTIQMPDGITQADVNLVRMSTGSNDLLITVDGLGQILVDNQFYFGPKIEYIDYDSGTLDITNLSIETIGTSGNDSLTGVTSGASTDDILDGREGNDTMAGAAGDDTYYFSEGNDTVNESTGSTSDTIAFRNQYGPEDIEVYRDGSTNYSRNLVFEDANGNSLKVGSHFYNTSYQIEFAEFADSTVWDFSQIEVETRGSSGADNIYAYDIGDASTDDTVYGFGGNDTLRGGYGNDVLYGGDGDDMLLGSVGDDTYVFESGLDTISESGGDAADTLLVSNGVTIDQISFSNYSSYDTKVIVNAAVDEVLVQKLRSPGSGYHVDRIAFDDGFETSLPDYSSWTWGTTGNETINGTTGDDTVIGMAGDDTLDGGAGADDIHGGAGADTLTGGAGDDLLHGGEGSDTVDYGNDGAAVTVNLATGTATDGNADTDTLYSIESVKGSAYNDTLTGSANGDYLYGDAGTDTIDGGAGADYLFGEGGTDTLTGGDGADQLSGGADADTLYGDAGNDVLYGDAGNDLLYGGDGLDSLYGSTGDDTFVFEAASAFNNVDVINDLDISTESDKINISDVLDGYYTAGVDDITNFVQITDDGTDSTLYIDQDGGADNFVAVASILGATGLTDEAALVTSGNLIAA